MCRRGEGTGSKGIATKFGGIEEDWGVGFIGTQTHLLPKFSFSSDFGHFFENVGKCKIVYVSRKKYRNIQISGGIVPRGFQKCGGPDPRDPPPPLPSATTLTEGVQEPAAGASAQSYGLHRRRCSLFIHGRSLHIVIHTWLLHSLLSRLFTSRY